MARFYWPNYIDIGEAYNGEEQLVVDISNALNELSHIPEFRELIRKHDEMDGGSILIIPGNEGNSYTNGSYIAIEQSDTLSEFMGIDGQFHEFTLEMLVFHELAHNVDSFTLPDPGATEFDQIEHIDDHLRQINAALRKHDLDPIRSSDTDEQKLLKGMQAEEIRVIEKMNEIREKYFPDLPLREPTAHGTIDANKIRVGQGQPGWENAENQGSGFVPTDERVSSENIREFFANLSAEDMQQIFGVDVEGFDNFELTYLWELANEKEALSDLSSEEYREQFNYSFGRSLIDNPEIIDKIFDAYENSLEQASYEAQPDTPTRYALDDPAVLQTQLASLDQSTVSDLPLQLQALWEVRDSEEMLKTLMEEIVPRIEGAEAITIASLEVQPEPQQTENFENTVSNDKDFSPPPTMT